eukprot:3582472-Rhodomonas_salina.1
MQSPLAKAIFRIDGVDGVFFGPDFITVTKAKDEMPWGELKAEIFAAIMDFYSSGVPILSEGVENSTDTVIHEDDSEVRRKQNMTPVVALIKELLDTRIRPAVQDDGGDINYVSFEEDSGV